MMFGVLVGNGMNTTVALAGGVSVGASVGVSVVVADAVADGDGVAVAVAVSVGVPVGTGMAVDGSGATTVELAAVPPLKPLHTPKLINAPTSNNPTSNKA